MSRWGGRYCGADRPGRSAGEELDTPGTSLRRSGRSADNQTESGQTAPPVPRRGRRLAAEPRRPAPARKAKRPGVRFGRTSWCAASREEPAGFAWRPLAGEADPPDAANHKRPFRLVSCVEQTVKPAICEVSGVHLRARCLHSGREWRDNPHVLRCRPRRPPGGRTGLDVKLDLCGSRSRSPTPRLRVGRGRCTDLVSPTPAIDDGRGEVVCSG